ncbi:MAG: adenylyl-sulfate kinase [Bacteroidales bacterium]
MIENKQKSKVVWFTGLSGAGKTTICKALALKMKSMGYLVEELDGDVLRKGLNSDLGFDMASRNENIRRAAEVSKILKDSGLICLSSFITPTRETREMVRNIIGKEDLIEIFVNAPLEVCEKRDVKGLYQKARLGLIPEFTGISSPFEEPADADLEIRTDFMTVEESVEKCMERIHKDINLGE